MPDDNQEYPQEPHTSDAPTDPEISNTTSELSTLKKWILLLGSDTSLAPSRSAVSTTCATTAVWIVVMVHGILERKLTGQMYLKLPLLAGISPSSCM
eukprot:15194213-Ditylum_brightwellii.AAC.1